jgi:hypothetical protein
MQCVTYATPPKIMVCTAADASDLTVRRWAGKAHDVTMKASRAAARRYLPGSPFNAPAPAPAGPAETFAVHDQVTHDKYGLGVILAVQDHAVLVDFRPDQRRIPLPCAKLTKL